jgi:hypothetical protein
MPDVDRRTHHPGHGRPGLVSPAFRHECDGVGPDTADSETHHETQPEHLFLCLDPATQSREHRIEPDADTHRARASDPVAQTAEKNASTCGTEHQCRREPRKPVPTERRCVPVAKQILGDRQ